ncbi:MAG: hypothetical protein ACRCXD_04940, partial [Luteolibacter sp.]
SSLMVLRGSKPAQVAGVEKIQSSKHGEIPLETHLAIQDSVAYPAAMDEPSKPSKPEGKKLKGRHKKIKSVHRFKTFEEFNNFKDAELLMGRKKPRVTTN